MAVRRKPVAAAKPAPKAAADKPEFDPDREYTATDPRTGKVSKVYGTIAAALVNSGYTVE
jgi:hypothetical protein